MPRLRRWSPPGRIDLLFHLERPAREHRQPVDDVLELLLGRLTGHEAGRGPRAALTIGFMVRSSLSSTPITESKGNPVLFTPSFWRALAGPSASQTRANTKSLEMLWMVNSCSASPMANTRPCTPATATPKVSGEASARAGM